MPSSDSQALLADGSLVAHRGEERQISIALSRGQINQVVRAALGEHVEPGLSSASAARNLYGSHTREALAEHYRSLQGNRRLSRSLLAGLLVLSCFAPDGPALGIKEISDELQLNSSTVHRYVATLLARRRVAGARSRHTALPAAVRLTAAGPAGDGGGPAGDGGGPCARQERACGRRRWACGRRRWAVRTTAVGLRATAEGLRATGRAWRDRARRRVAPARSHLLSAQVGSPERCAVPA